MDRMRDAQGKFHFVCPDFGCPGKYLLLHFSKSGQWEAAGRYDSKKAAQAARRRLMRTAKKTTPH